MPTFNAVSTNTARCATTLVIVESPAKCRKIEEYLGPGYVCLASMGHFREIAKMEDIDVANGFAITFTEMNKVTTKKKALAVIRVAARSADTVVLATDDDREGEAIAWHLCDALGLNVETTPRIVFHEITRTAVCAAMTRPTRINMNIVRAQQARQVIDMLVGYHISPLLWKRVCRTYSASNGKRGGGSSAFSAGRCQTPALRLIYDASLAECNKKQVDGASATAYHAFGLFTGKNIRFELSKPFADEVAADAFLQSSASDHKHIFSRDEPRVSSRKAPSPLTTSRVQQMCSNDMGISPKDTMQSCQRLYEAGLITYMRTDSARYAPEFLLSAGAHISRKYNDDRYLSAPVRALLTGSDTKKDADADAETCDREEMSAHEGIRPTDAARERIDDIASASDDFTKRDHRVYRLVWQTAMESCMASSEYSKYMARIVSPRPDACYEHTAQHRVFAGWESIKDENKSDAKTTSDDEMYVYLRTLVHGCEVAWTVLRAEERVPVGRGHYTEARLVQMLEERGIGRPSTFSSLVDKIQERGYVKRMHVPGRMVQCVNLELRNTLISTIVRTSCEREVGAEKNKLVVQQTGVLVIEYLVAHFPHLFAYEYTREMEERLELVSSGDVHWTAPCESVLGVIRASIGSLVAEETTKIEIPVDSEHVYIVGKHGPVLKYTPAEGGSVTFKQIREDIDMVRLRAHEYTVEEMLVVSASRLDIENEQWMHDGKTVQVKKGPYGLYVQWGADTVPLRGFGNRPPENIRLDEVIPRIDKHVSLGVGIARELTKELSIRVNKTGNLYVYFKTPSMRRPVFGKVPPGVTKANLANYTDDVLILAIDTAST